MSAAVEALQHELARTVDAAAREELRREIEAAREREAVDAARATLRAEEREAQHQQRRRAEGAAAEAEAEQHQAALQDALERAIRARYAEAAALRDLREARAKRDSAAARAARARGWQAALVSLPMDLHVETVLLGVAEEPPAADVDARVRDRLAAVLG